MERTQHLFFQRQAIVISHANDSCTMSAILNRVCCGERSRSILADLGPSILNCANYAAHVAERLRISAHSAGTGQMAWVVSLRPCQSDSVSGVAAAASALIAPFLAFSA